MARSVSPTTLLVAAAALSLVACDQQDTATGVHAPLRDDSTVSSVTPVTAPTPALLRTAVSPSLCGAVAYESTQPGTRVVTWTCDSTSATRRFALRSDGLVTIGDGTRCLDVMPPKAKGAEVVTWTCATSEATQHWTLTAAGELTNVQGLCLTIAFEDAQPGRYMVLWPCNGGAAQKWTIAAPSPAASAPPPPVTVTAEAPVGTAELPRTFLNTAAPTVTGRTISVPVGGDLQGALNAALPGDQVVLAAGATYVGNFVLPAKANAAGQWITVRTAGNLPTEGTRVSPADAAQMPKILTPNAAPAVATAPGTQGWRFTGVEVSATPGVTMAYMLMTFGTVGTAQNTLAQVPSRIVVDRSYVHGLPTLDLRRCIALNSASTAVIDSYVSECHSRDGDSQAVMGWNGPGPFKIVNNRLEGGHENIAFGGGDPSINGMLPADIEIRRNHVIKPLSWKGVWTAKNLLELKVGVRVLVEANVFENNWVDGQNGFSLLWWSVNQDGGCTWCTTQDVTFRNNVVRNVAGGFNLTATGDRPVPAMQRVTIANNVITGLDPSNGRLYQVNGAVAGLTIVNNSGVGIAHDLVFATPDLPVPSLVFRNNVTGAQYTLFAAGYMGNTAVARMGIPAGNVTGNVFASGSGPGAVPTGNTFAPSATGLIPSVSTSGDPTASLMAASAGTSATGADFSRIAAATQGVVH